MRVITKIVPQFDENGIWETELPYFVFLLGMRIRTDEWWIEERIGSVLSKVTFKIFSDGEIIPDYTWIRATSWPETVQKMQHLYYKIHD